MSELDVERAGLTIRLKGRHGTLSLDNGSSAAIPPELAAALVTQLAQVDTAFDGRAMSAGAQASMAEANAACPIQGAIDPPTSAENLVETLRRNLRESEEFHSITDVGPSRTLEELLARRKSTRVMGPVDVSLLGIAMARAALVRQRWDGSDGYDESRRPVPSAGARHPHALVVLAQDVVGLASGSWVLDPDAAALYPSSHSASAANGALSEICDALRLVEPPPAVIFTVALPGQTLTRYPAGMSLLWRDAGALQFALHLTSLDIGMSSCIVGTSGILYSNEESPWAPFDTGAVAVGFPN